MSIRVDDLASRGAHVTEEGMSDRTKRGSGGTVTEDKNRSPQLVLDNPFHKPLWHAGYLWIHSRGGIQCIS